MRIPEVLESMFAKMGEVGKCQRKFLKELFILIFSIQGHLTFINMSRSSRLHESRIPRHYSEFSDWTKFNLLMMQLSGLDRFGSGAACPAQGELEVSLLSLIDTLIGTAWSLYAEQTPAGLSQAEAEFDLNQPVCQQATAYGLLRH